MFVSFYVWPYLIRPSLSNARRKSSKSITPFPLTLTFGACHPLTSSPTFLVTISHDYRRGKRTIYTNRYTDILLSQRCFSVSKKAVAIEKQSRLSSAMSGSNFSALPKTLRRLCEEMIPHPASSNMLNARWTFERISASNFHLDLNISIRFGDEL